MVIANQAIDLLFRNDMEWKNQLANLLQKLFEIKDRSFSEKEQAQLI